MTALFVSAALFLIAIPVVGGRGRLADNPSILPTPRDRVCLGGRAGDIGDRASPAGAVACQHWPQCEPLGTGGQTGMDSTLTEDELPELDVILARAAAAGIDPHRVVLALGLDAEAVASQIERARAQSGG